ncbi:unnamed protein product [Fusarium fujikuroi]|uniref:Uncharacterized protein n=1 Tax=Fusarium fujikuroi TaxID=5127 RepID=A0A9Q9RVV5_FUSFU|nr:unnamed protein product [Fusarium fujikuroi]
MADLEPPAHIITIVASLKSLVAEVRIEASKLNRLNLGTAYRHKDVEDIYALLDANLNELEAAVELVVTEAWLAIDVSKAAQGVPNDAAQQTSILATTSENEAQSVSSQLDVSSEPHPPASPSSSPELKPWSYSKKATSNAAKAAVHKRQVKTRTSVRLNKTAQPEPIPNRYEKRIDDRDDIQKAQVSGLAEAMKRRSTDTWDLEPKDGWDVNKNTIMGDSEDRIRIRTTNTEQSFHSPGFEGLKDRITARRVGRKLACFISHPKRYIPFYAGVMKSPLWNLCPLRAGRLADIGGLRRANVPYAHCPGQYAGTAMHKEEANFGSASVGFAGITAFLFVDTRGTTMLQDWVRDTIPDAPPKEKSCDQWVCHLSILFRPEKLEEGAVRSTVLLQRVGDLIFTKRNSIIKSLFFKIRSLSRSTTSANQKHTASFMKRVLSAAVRTNTAFTSLYLLAGSHVEIMNNEVQKDRNEKQSTTMKITQIPEGSNNEPWSANIIRDFLRTAGPDLLMPQTLESSEVRMYRMISTISNETDLTDDNYMNVYPRYFDQVKKQTILTEFQVEYARSCLAKRTLEVLQEEGRDRVTATNIDQVAQKLGLDVGTSLKMKDIYHVGRAWNKFCDDFD